MSPAARDREGGPAAARGRRSRLLGSLRLLGWLALLGAGAWLALDTSGWIQREIERQLRDRLAPLGRLEVGSVHIDWIGPGVELRDLRLVVDDRERLAIGRLHVSAALDLESGLKPSRVHLDGGRLSIAEDGVERLRSWVEQESGGPEAGPVDFSLPSIQVRDLVIAAEGPAREDLLLGTLDLSMRVEHGVPSRLEGRLRLPARDRDAATTEVYVSGLLGSDGRLELHTITDSLELASWDMPDLPLFDAIEGLSPAGRVSLYTTGSLRLTGEDPEVRGNLRARIEQGSLRVPGVEPALEALGLELEAHYEPGADEDIWTPGAWRGGGRLSAAWAGENLHAGLRLGDAARPGLALESWVHGLGLSTLNPALQAIEEPTLVPIIRDGFDPRGRVSASLGLTIADSLRPGDELWPLVELAVLIEEAGPLRAAFHGVLDEDEPEARPLAYPMPVDVEDVTVVVAHQKRFPRQELIEVRFSGTHASGPAHGSYQTWSAPVDMPPFAPGYGEFEYDLVIVVPSINIDGEVDRYLPELWEVPELGTLFQDYGLREEGTANVLVRVAWRAGMATDGAVLVDVKATGVDATWAELPVPAEGLNAFVRVIDNGNGANCVAFRADGTLADAGPLRVAGRVRSEGADPLAEEQPLRFDLVRVELEELELPGASFTDLRKALEEVDQAVADLEPRGRLDVDYTRATRGSAAPGSWIEIDVAEPGLRVRPAAFPLEVEAGRGRLLVEALEKPDEGSDAPDDVEVERVEVRVAPLVASLGADLPIGVEADWNSERGGGGRLVGAALRPADRALLERIATAAGLAPEEFLAGFEELEVGGAIDFDYAFELVEDSKDPEGVFRFRLRENLCHQLGGLLVDRISGSLVWTGDRLEGDSLRAQLGEIPFELSAVELRLEGEKVVIEADVQARDVLLDAPLLGQFIEPEMVRSLVEEFELRGRLDVEQGHIRLELIPDREPRLVFSGTGTLSDAQVTVGLPLSIRSARVDLEELVIQGEDVRGWCRVHDLYGQAVERDLAQANLLLSYHGSQVTIESLSGQFCRGRIGGLGTNGTVGGPVLSVDLHAPYRFQAQLGLWDVEIRELLEDVFASEIADRGFLTGQVSMHGELANLLDVRGAGWGRVDQTVLWSVPVVRDLFSQLGFDETAVFDEMRTEFTLGDGRIDMQEVHVHSPLLNLQGSGSLGIDGTLHHDLEVRYSLMDKTGPVGSLIHWLQSSLLSISVRGDMSRPRVILRGVFTSPFTDPDDTFRALPAPGFSPLRSRF